MTVPAVRTGKREQLLKIRQPPHGVKFPGGCCTGDTFVLEKKRANGKHSSWSQVIMSRMKFVIFKKNLQFLLLSADIMAQDTWRKKMGQKFSLFSCNSEFLFADLL